MKSLQIMNTKLFMSKLLVSESFDMFLMENAELKVGTDISVDGHVNKEFYGNEDESAPSYELIKWGEIRPTIYNLVKGKHTPIAFKFILSTTPDEKNSLLADSGEDNLINVISSFVIRIKFSNGCVTLTTGTALSGFSMDKSYEKLWDSHIESLLSEIGIPYEEL